MYSFTRLILILIITSELAALEVSLWHVVVSHTTLRHHKFSQCIVSFQYHNALIITNNGAVLTLFGGVPILQNIEIHDVCSCLDK